MTTITHLAQPRSGWPAIGAYALASSAAMIMQLTFAPITTVAAERYGVSIDAIGWLGQLFALFYVVFALPMGIALDRWFRKSLAHGVTLGAVLRVVDETYVWALSGQVVAAVGQPLVLNGIAKLAANYLPAKDRPLGIALCAAGQLMAVGLGTLFSEPEQVSTVLHISAAYSIVAAILGAALLPAWVAKRQKEYTLLLVSGGAATLGSILLSMIPGFVTGLMIMTLLGLLQLSVLPIVLEFVERRTGPAAATATAIAWMAGNAGVGIISMAVQSLIENPSAAFLFLASMGAMTLPFILVLQRQARMLGPEYGLVEGQASS